MLQCRQRTGHLSSFWVPTPRNLPPKVKKIANVRWSAQRGGVGEVWTQLELTVMA